MSTESEPEPPSDVEQPFEGSVQRDGAVQTPESQAMKWSREESSRVEPANAINKRKKYVVIGAGWAGWGAAKALCESGIDADVTILDALPDPTGKTPYLSKTGKPVEPGTRGLWLEYPNINALCAQLGLAENDVFTEFTESSFYSPDGLEVSAPVFSNASLPDFGNVPFLSALSNQRIPNTLPSPLGQVLATFPLFERLPLSDRASMFGLLVAAVDCLAGDEKTQAAYDRMTAHELFIRFKLSPRLIGDILGPTLLVGLFKPPEELSALVVMELLYYYALAHMNSFDVRWIKNGTVSNSLVAPLATRLVEKHNMTVLGGSRVTRISLTDKDAYGKQSVSTIAYQDSKGATQNISDIDGVVLALSSKGMKSVVTGSPDLARYNVFSKAASCKGIDVISVRLWLDKVIPTRTPANVFARFEELRGAGGTFFMLDQLQSEHLTELWGGDTPQGSVVACDFYNAEALLSVPEEDIIKTLMQDLLPSAVPEFANARVVDSWVGKFEGAVSWFAPGSFGKRPPLQGIPQIPNLKCAGDWVRMGDREHGSKGLCQERAYVTGLEAANLLLQETAVVSKAHPVLPVRDDEIQFKAAVALNQKVMKFLPRFWVR
ncbi:hypothetical protein MPSEU_000299000 [Mayamaea pseudoterrestris]|nr:hypothetical protein MPSEU_000299000 [Mayamaea pseudoterrestris]